MSNSGDNKKWHQIFWSVSNEHSVTNDNRNSVIIWRTVVAVAVGDFFHSAFFHTENKFHFHVSWYEPKFITIALIWARQITRRKITTLKIVPKGTRQKRVYPVRNWKHSIHSSRIYGPLLWANAFRCEH